MESNKRLTILAGIALLVIVIAAVLIGRRAPEAEGSLIGAPVLPGLAEKVNEVERLRFVRAGGETSLTLERGDTGWTLAERGGYPVDSGKLRLALLNLGESKRLEAKTANPERYAQIGVQEIDAPGATGTLIEIDGAGSMEHRLIVGNQAAGEGTYVRVPGQAQSLLATGNLVPDPQVGPWLVKDITDIPSSRIREIEQRKGDGTPFRVYKDRAEDDNYTVADVPRGREVVSAYVANGLASMLSGLVLEDVAVDRDDAHGEHEVLHASYRLFDGVVIDVQGWQGPESVEGSPGPGYIRLSARLDEDRAQEKITADVEAEQAALSAAAEEAEGESESETEIESETAQIDIDARRQERLAELRAEVDQINTRTSGWLYTIPGYKIANLTKSLDDLLKPRD